MRMGPIRQDMTWSYNERGDEIELSMTAGGFPHETGEISEPPLKSSHAYEYDEHGNWTSKTESSRVGEREMTYARVRQLTYYN